MKKGFEDVEMLNVDLGAVHLSYTLWSCHQNNIIWMNLSLKRNKVQPDRNIHNWSAWIAFYYVSWKENLIFHFASNITELGDNDITYLLENSYVLDTAPIHTTSIIFIESAKCYPEASSSLTFILQVGKRGHKMSKQLVQVQLAIPKLLGQELKPSSTHVKLLTVTHHHHSDHTKKSLCHLTWTVYRLNQLFTVLWS